MILIHSALDGMAYASVEMKHPPTQLHYVATSVAQLTTKHSNYAKVGTRLSLLQRG